MSSGAPNEVYTHGYSPLVEAYMAARTASQQAGFFLGHLRVGMDLLDCGVRSWKHHA